MCYFDKREGYAEVDVVNNAQKLIQENIDNGNLEVPNGLVISFQGVMKIRSEP